MSQQIKRDQIRYLGIDVRAKLDREAIAEYADRFADGSPFPPIDVYFDGETYWLGDGRHRDAAAASLGHDTIAAEVHAGDKWNALEHAIKSNRDHGVRLTQADKRKTVERALTHKVWCDWSDVQLAKFCGVSDKTVASVRNGGQSRNSDAVSGTAKRVGADGKKYAARKPRAKKADAAAAAQPPVEPVAEAAAEEGPDFDPTTLDATDPAKVDIKGLAAPYQADIRLMNAKRKEWLERAEEPRTGAHIAPIVTRIEYHFKELAAAISQAEPVEICSSCDGVGCNTCANTGFWTRAIKGSRKT